jgi:hypothetical protein
MAAPVVALVGLRAFQRDVLKLTADRGPLVALFRRAGLAAAEPVADAARAALPQQSGRLAGDVRASGSRTGGTVRMGRASVRYAGWVEFGGRRRVPHESARDYTPQGRYLFPNARQLAPRAETLYTQALNDGLASFPWTNQTADGGAVHD